MVWDEMTRTEYEYSPYDMAYERTREAVRIIRDALGIGDVQVADDDPFEEILHLASCVRIAVGA